MQVFLFLLLFRSTYSKVNDNGLKWVPQRGCWDRPDGSFQGSCPQCSQDGCVLQCDCFSGRGVETRRSELDVSNCFYSQYIGNNDGHLSCVKSNMMDESEEATEEDVGVRNYGVIIESHNLDDDFSLVIRVNRQSYTIRKFEQTIMFFIKILMKF